MNHHYSDYRTSIFAYLQHLSPSLPLAEVVKCLEKDKPGYTKTGKKSVDNTNYNRWFRVCQVAIRSRSKLISS
jgi:hypothetical protein